jgi:hypothetical protein
LEAITKKRSQIRLEGVEGETMPDLAKLTDQQQENKLIRIEDIYCDRGSTLETELKSDVGPTVGSSFAEMFPARDPVAMVLSSRAPCSLRESE